MRNGEVKEVQRIGLLFKHCIVTWLNAPLAAILRRKPYIERGLLAVIVLRVRGVAGIRSIVCDMPWVWTYIISVACDCNIPTHDVVEAHHCITDIRNGNFS